MVYIASKKIVPKEKQAAFLEMAKKMVACSQKEAGCLSYALTVSRDDENTLCYMERWESQAHVEAHMQSEHFRTYSPMLTALCDATELTLWDDAFEKADL